MHTRRPAICRVMRDISDLEVAITVTVASQTRGNICLASTENLIAPSFICLMPDSSRIFFIRTRSINSFESFVLFV